MRRFKNLKKHHFLFCLAISILFLTILGYVDKGNIYADYSVDLLKVPQLSVVFMGAKEENYPWMIGSKRSQDLDTETEVELNSNMNLFAANQSESTLDNGEGAQDLPDSDEKLNLEKEKDSAANRNKNEKDSDNQNSKVNSTEEDKEGARKNKTNKGDTVGKENPTDKGNNQDNEFKTVENNNLNGKDSIDENDKKEVEEKSSYQFETVEEDYFKDALFIGDSRTVGLSEYSGWTEPTYFAEEGLTIYDIFDKKIAKVNGKKMTIDKALKKQKFGKIYIMLGINEMGRGTRKTFVAEYKKVLEKIQSLQPDAIIFIEGIMNVTKKKSDTDPIFNNKNIKDRNEGIAELADNKNIFYIDVNEAITDDSGGIPEEYTFDNIHLKAEYYKIWTDFLLEHGIVK